MMRCEMSSLGISSIALVPTIVLMMIRHSCCRDRGLPKKINNNNNIKMHSKLNNETSHKIWHIQNFSILSYCRRQRLVGESGFV